MKNFTFVGSANLSSFMMRIVAFCSIFLLSFTIVQSQSNNAPSSFEEYTYINKVDVVDANPNFSEVLVTFRDVKVNLAFADTFIKQYPNLSISKESPVFKPLNALLFKVNATNKNLFNKLKQNLLLDNDVVAVYPSFVLDGGTKAYVSNKVFISFSNRYTKEDVIKLLNGKAKAIEFYTFIKQSILIVEVNKDVDVFKFSLTLHKSDGIMVAQPDFNSIEKSKFTPNDQFYDDQWALSRIDASQAWNSSNGNSAVVGILDNGFDLSHPDIQNKIVSPFNAVDNNNNLTPENNNAKHGTPCMSLIAANTNNNLGIASIGYNTDVCPIRIGYNQQSNGTFTTSATILVRAANHLVNLQNLCAVSNSYASSSYQSSRKAAYDLMRTDSRNGLGAVVLAAMGNDGNNNETSYPAWYDGVVSVGATSGTDSRASFSNYGDNIDISAPGVSLYALDRQGSQGYTSNDYNSSFSGTSGACPIAAGTIALMSSANSALSGQQLADFIEQSCEKVGGYSYNNENGHPNGTWDHRLGYGRINAKDAVELAINANGEGGISCNCPLLDNQFPSGTQTPTLTFQTISCQYAGEFAQFYVTSGNTYIFSYCSVDGGNSNGIDVRFNMFDEDGNRVACNMDTCNLDPRIEWTADYTGIVKLQTNQYISGAQQCETNSVCVDYVYKKLDGGGSSESCDQPYSLNATNITDTSAIINWSLNTVSCDIDGSDVRLYEGANTSGTTVESWNDYSGTSISLSGLSPNSTYTYRVRHDCDCNDLGRSDYVTFTFTTTGNSESCDIPYNLNATNITDTSAIINWSLNTVSCDIDGSDVRLYEGSNTSGTTVENWSDYSGTSISLSGLNPNSTYTYRVRHDCDCNDLGRSDYVTFTFTTSESQLSIGDMKNLGILIYPNPVDTILKIKNPDGLVIKRIEIYSILGTKVKQFEANRIINLGKLQSGIYFVRLYLEGGRTGVYKVYKK